MTSTELMNVSAFKGMSPAGAFSSLNAQAESLADGIGSSYGIIGYKGKVWTLRHRGERYTFTRPDDGSPLAFLDVIILRDAGTKAKSYYPEGSYEAEGSEGTRPRCASINGIKPDEDSVEKQALACAICPRNEWKLNSQGHKGRECSDYKRLAVLIIPSLSARLLGSALMEPVFLRVPAASLNDLAMFGEAMSKQGWHYASFVTRIGFMAEKSHPQMTFRALQPLTDAEAPVVLPMRSEAMTMRITGEDQLDKVVTGPATSNALPQTVVQPAQPVTAVKPNPVAETVNTGFVQTPAVNQTATAPAIVAPVQAAPVQAVQEVIPPAQREPEPATVDTGFGSLGAAQTTVEVQAEPARQTAADVGEAELSDTSLDDAVAALLKTA